LQVKALLACVILCLSGITVFSQEILTGLQINPVIRNQILLEQQVPESSLQDSVITLPFFDDFSGKDIFPEQSRWTDRDVFVNTDFPVYPINIGAATFDAIDDSGKIHRDAVPGPQTFIGDHLTSKYIRLDSVFTPIPRKLTAADSVYFSFYYQPQGRGLSPELADSLVLQFLLRPAYDTIIGNDTVHYDDKWVSVWSVEGMTLINFHTFHNRYFDRVMIPVTNENKFFKKFFRFRFFNFVSLASTSLPSWQSNCDQWNVDYIRLDINRSMADTTYPAIAFIERTPSMLKNYATMPYKQYCDDPTNEMASSLTVAMANLDSINHTAQYGFSMKNSSGSFSKSYDGGSYDMPVYWLTGPIDYPPWTHPPVQYLFPIAAADSAHFFITHTLTGSSGFGDTIASKLIIHNLYAYDDGTPEAGYGTTPSGAMVAYRFKLNVSPDTLRAVSIFFNRTLSNANEQFFYLNVWEDNNGKPGDLIYSSLELPAFHDTLNKFHTYHLDPPARISGTFYVGYQQTTNDFLNIGFDTYNNAQENIFVNVTGSWSTSIFQGSPLIRPIIGKPIPLGIENPAPGSALFSVYPNPVKDDVLFVQALKQENLNYRIHLYDIYGRQIMDQPLTHQLPVSSLTNGLYLLMISSQEGFVYSAKIVISR